MKLKYRFVIPLYLFLFLLQCTVLPQFDLFSCTPNLMLCLTVLLALRNDSFMGMGIGFAAGLLQDMFFGERIGIAALCYFGLTLVIMLTKQFTYKNSTTSVMIFGAVSTVMYSFLYWVLSWIMGSGYHILYMVKMLPQLLIYNCFVLLLMHFILHKQEKKYPEDRFM